ncbi:hypothetical protein BDV96DRAFT_650482 [Lophiotrema nucula]|uniref:Uncharacterized protein n=1 Tax=Lophiotrema nucula TaxID=690887 RepID=A0A6A5YXK7_9PLEO|nr:hypothetical protein BDV96DRAFT_650482 [Lophiotrema nucula]
MKLINILVGLAAAAFTVAHPTTEYGPGIGGISNAIEARSGAAIPWEDCGWASERDTNKDPGVKLLRPAQCQKFTPPLHPAGVHGGFVHFTCECWFFRDDQCRNVIQPTKVYWPGDQTATFEYFGVEGVHYYICH